MPDRLNACLFYIHQSITYLAFIFQEDGSLKNVHEPTPSEINELVRLGFAMTGNKSEISFGNEWGISRLHNWLKDILPVPSKQLDLLSDAEEHQYPWRLLKASRSRLQLYHELPDGYDVISAKGSKSKGWQDSKLYFGK